ARHARRTRPGAVRGQRLRRDPGLLRQPPGHAPALPGRMLPPARPAAPMVTTARRLVAVAIAVALMPVAACTPTEPAPQPTATCLEPPDGPAAEQPALTAPGGGQLRITEQGYTRLPGHPFVL